jgi:hypothetical protein
MMRRCSTLGLILWFAAGSVRGAAAAPAPSPPRVITLGFVGDLMMHEANRSLADYRELYRDIETLLRDDDLTFANLEFPVDPGRPYAGFPRFNGTPAYVRAAAEAGIDAFSLANNHAFDGGEEGVLQTLRSLDRIGGAVGRSLLRAGTRANPAAPFLAARAEVRGVRIAFLAATEFLNTRAGGERVAVVDYHDAHAGDEFAAAVSAESAVCEVVVVSYHGGVEYSTDPSPRLDAFLDRLASCGATIVYAHHPHVLQAPRFVYRGLSRSLVLPSMGNFVSGQADGLDPVTGRGAVAPGTGDSALVRARLACGRGWATVIGVEAVPLAVHGDGRGTMIIGRLEDLAGPSGQRGGRTAAAWQTYYRGRLDSISGLLAGVVTSCGPGALPRK